MQDVWYGDNRDLVKWGVLLRLADLYEADRVLQLAFYRDTKKFERLVIDHQEQEIPPEVIAHFRDIRAIGSVSSKVRVTVLDLLLRERDPYIEAARAFLSAFQQERCIVFLDPDKGLEPQKKPTLEHAQVRRPGNLGCDESW